MKENKFVALELLECEVLSVKVLSILSGLWGLRVVTFKSPAGVTFERHLWRRQLRNIQNLKRGKVVTIAYTLNDTDDFLYNRIEVSHVYC